MNPIKKLINQSLNKRLDYEHHCPGTAPAGFIRKVFMFALNAKRYRP